MSFAVYRFVFLVLSLQYFGVLTKVVKICRVYNIEQCKRSANSNLYINEFRIYQPKGKSTVYYMDVTASRDLDEDPGLEITVKKCLARENPDTCEPFTTLKPSNPCMFMFMKNMMWTNFVENIEPPAACRVKKGHYILKNATLDPELFSIFPITGYNWKLELKFFEANGIDFITVCVDAQIIAINV